MAFFELTANLIGKLVLSVAGRSLSESIKDIRTERRMARMVEDAVDRIVAQLDEYLKNEKLGDEKKIILIETLYSRMKPLVEDPQRLFAGDLDGTLIFKQSHPNQTLPKEITDENLGQYYTVLFPQIAHFIAGSKTALVQWQAEGYREEFKRLTQIAEEIRAMNVKIAEIPSVVIKSMSTKDDQKSEILLREFSQTLLSNLLVRLDLSPLRAERALHGSLRDHFVIPAIRQRGESIEPVENKAALISALAPGGGRRVLHGGAGVGKTTCALWVQSELLQSEPQRLAVVLRLREFEKIEDHSLLFLLQRCAGAHLRDQVLDSVIRSWCAGGRLVVILDGFDEIPEQRRDMVENWIKGLSAVIGQSTLIVTSRPLQSGHLEDLEGAWQQWNLLPFNRERIVDFIGRWHRHLPTGELSDIERNVDPGALAEKFLNDPTLKPLADTPLMLGTLLFVHHRDKQLPSGRVDLYERYIAAMLGLRDSGLGIQARATKLSDKEKRRVLAHIALSFHVSGVNEANDTTIRSIVREALDKFKFNEDVERLLPALHERTGLLQGPGAWSFTHKTVSEFLVAELICEGTTRLANGGRLDRKELWVHRFEDAWTAVLFFWAGKTSPRELEEFLDDLLHENAGGSLLLVLSLLSDQGDRLSFESRRSVALRMIRGELPASSGESRATSSSCPRSIYVSIPAPMINLPGLSQGGSTNALRELLAKAVLMPSDMGVASDDFKSRMTVATIWALRDRGSAVTIDVCSQLAHVPSEQLAMVCFYSFVDCLILGDDVDVKKVRAAIDQWLAAFPGQRQRLPLLVMGLGMDFIPRDQYQSGVAEKIIGPLLFEWYREGISDQLLVDSEKCVAWLNKDDFDIIAFRLKSLNKLGASAYGVNSDQYIEIKKWLEQILSRRGEVKAGTVR